MTFLTSLVLLMPLAQQPAGQQNQDPPRASELRMAQFRPQHIDARVLFQVAGETLGRTIHVTYEDSQQTVQRYNLQLLGDAITIYERPQSITAIVDSLKKLDTEYGAADTGSDDEDFATLEFRPRYASLTSLRQAAEPFQVSHFGDDPSRAFGNLQVVEERGVMVIRDEKARANEILEFLKRLDEPAPQVLITAYLVSGADEPVESDNLPGDLVEGLTPLIGKPALVRDSLAMVRTSVGIGQVVSLSLQTTQRTFQLELMPSAYSQADGSLTLGACRFSSMGQPILSTQTSLSTGEFVVLGATGVSPMFVVLHVQPVGR